MTSWLKAKFGRMRVSTMVLIVAFIALFWVYHNFEPVATEAPPAVVPPGFVPDPNYTWVPRTNVRQPKEPVITTTTTSPTTTTTTSPTETTTTSPGETTTSPTSPTESTPVSPTTTESLPPTTTATTATTTPGVASGPAPTTPAPPR